MGLVGTGGGIVGNGGRGSREWGEGCLKEQRKSQATNKLPLRLWPGVDGHKDQAS